jgi:protoporphyrinogen oxidase
MRVGIIGAGPAGLSAAHELLEKAPGTEVHVFEQDPRFVGGISRTVEYKGYRFDIGGHRFFSKSHEIESFWANVLGDDLITRNRMSRIFYNGRFYDYPLKPGNAFRNMGLVMTILCVTDYLRAKMLPRKPVVTFEDWVVNQFGERLYRMFFKTYTEKVWGIPCDVISADWAAQRIKGLNLAAAIRNAFQPKKSGGPVIKTLIDSFRYPKLGPGMLWERLAEAIRARGGTVHMGTRVVKIRHANGVATELTVQSGDDRTNSTVYAVDHVISSMPLRSLVRGLEPKAPGDVLSAAESLKYRDFITVSLIVDHPDLFPDNWIYIHDPSVKVGRIQNFKNWSPYMVPDPTKTCLGLEYFCFEGDGLWTTDDDGLIKLASEELRRVGLLREARVIDGTVVRVPKAYPVYDDVYKDNVAKAVSWLAEHAANVQVVGRNGMHRYNNQDHAIMTGFLAARNLLGGSYNLWSVNGDAEYLEEVSDDRAVPTAVR